MIIAIDPGKYLCGVALLSNEGEVYAACVSKPSLDPGLSSGRRWVLLADEVLCFVKNNLHLLPPDDTVTLIVEDMQVYAQDGASKADSLLDLQAVGGCVIGYLSANLDVGRIVTVRPREWKGQVPRDVTTNRMLAKFADHPGVRWPKDKKTQGDVAAALALGLYCVRGR